MKGPTASYKFYICEFVGCYNEEGSNDMDILSRDWIKFYHVNKKLMAPYPDPPYTQKVCSKFQESVRLNKQPDKKWKLWEVKLKGGANDYEKTESRLKQMRSDAYGFITDMENQQSKADDETNAFKNENIEDILAQESDGSSTSTPSVEDSASLSVISNDEESNVRKGRKNSTKKREVVVKKKGINKHVQSKAKSVTPTPTISKPTAQVMTPKPTISTPPIDLTTSPTDGLDNLSGDELIKHTEKALNTIEAVTNRTYRTTQRNSSSTFDLPTLQVTSETNVILKSISGLKILVLKLQSDVTELKNKMLDSHIQRLNETLQQNNLKLPLATADDWLTFCDILEDTSLQDYFSFYIKQQLDIVGNNPIKSCSNILKKIFEKKLILQFTAFKKMLDREFVFKDSICFKLLKMVILSNHHDTRGDLITEATFNSSLSSAFSNSKD
ncbi:uncharacterized protein LOC131663327 [Phymastichus coffea]|uniref:uncharacterized protein LOC131663327 n=1 Tax=Phymastichus coffea TaxID=108790 RepID=UPI00273B39D9|nr:uncharacterized protein LOC131663327 [Phymastichus coffea]